LEDLKAVYAETALAGFFAELQTDIAADRRQLQGLMDRLQIVESRPRKVSAWLTEKSIELKLRWDDSALVVFRVIYFLVPFMIGVALFAAYELTLRRRKK
jgi:uncharacterized membrane protein YbhN (UPF0104 family)